MARAPQSRGDCVFCGREFAKAGMTRHLKTCAKRVEAQAEADKTRRHPQKLYHLLIQSAWSSYYWLHLEMRGSATLKDLDDYLREIWLECCGHLSAFEIGGVSYASSPDPWGWGEDRSMNAKVGEVLSLGAEISYEYDFGSTTELTIKVSDERTGKPLTEHPIYLMARNKLEAPACMECAEPAIWVCAECMAEREDGRCELCEAHADEHEHEEMLMRIVNSPRVGVCGYDGPAEPPY